MGGAWRDAKRKRSTAGSTISLTKAVKSSPAQRALIGSKLVSFMPGSVLISSKNGLALAGKDEIDACVVAAAAGGERRFR
jgi:transcription elongation GreA/GreB family factor